MASRESSSLIPETPLNMKAVFGICSIIFMDICINNALTPMMPNMVAQWFPSDYVGFFVGVLVTVYFCGQIICSPIWGYMGDKFGRRITLILGILGNTLGVIIFGFALDYTTAVVGRSTSGVLSGASTIAKSYLGELTDATNAQRAFSKFGIAYGLAVTIGPTLGGFLSEPADRWDSMDNDFWNEHPYLLPVLVLASMSVLTFIYAYMFLDETKSWLKSQGKLPKQTYGATEKIELLSSTESKLDFHEDFNNTVDDGEPVYYDFPGMCSCLNRIIPRGARNSLVGTSIAIVSLNAVIYMSYDVMFSVFLEAPVSDGGLGLSTELTGYFTSVYGLTMIIYNAKFYKDIAKELGSRTCVYRGFLGFAGLFVFFPFLSYVGTAYDSWVVYTFIVMCQIARGIAGSTATMACQVIISQASHSSVLGQVNGIANSFTALGKLVGPFFIGGLWTFSLTNFADSRYIRVSTTYWVLLFIALLSTRVVLKLPKQFKVQTHL